MHNQETLDMEHHLPTYADESECKIGLSIGLIRELHPLYYNTKLHDIFPMYKTVRNLFKSRTEKANENLETAK